VSHKQISFVKSGVRIAGYVMGGYAFNGLLAMAFVVLIVSEIIGILEEIGE
jgi:hypothetical protein